ncbi:hypothetical protein C8R43DRAFT_1143018 [Mycena crocata]|nr:hypothetical protein C8R43DRAFT_1143018 [Mycena crocata]
MKLTAAQVAERLSPEAHPERLSADELEALTGHLSVDELQSVLDRIGLGAFSRQVVPSLGRLLLAAQRLQRQEDPADDDEVGAMLRNLQLVEISDSPPSTPPATPQPRHRRTRRRDPAAPVPVATPAPAAAPTPVPVAAPAPAVTPRTLGTHYRLLTL